MNRDQTDAQEHQVLVTVVWWSTCNYEEVSTEKEV